MAGDIPEASDALTDLSGQMERLDLLATQFGRSISRAFSSGIAQGKSFDDILQGLGQRLIDISLRAAFRPLESGIGNLVSGLTGSITGLFTGGAASSGDLLSSFFGGAASSGNGGGLSSFVSNAAQPSSGIIVNMAVSTPDADSFRRSESQLSASLARAVARGQRAL